MFISETESWQIIASYNIKYDTWWNFAEKIMTAVVLVDSLGITLNLAKLSILGIDNVARSVEDGEGFDWAFFDDGDFIAGAVLDRVDASLEILIDLEDDISTGFELDMKSVWFSMVCIMT